MTKVSATPRACLTKVTTGRMQGHRVLKMVANMFNLFVAAQKFDSNKVAEEEDVVLDLEVDTEEGYEVRAKQKATRATEVPERTTITMGTEASQTKERGITPIEEVAEMVTEVL